VIGLTATAEAALDTLASHYAALGRDRAIYRLLTALERACARYETQSGRFFSAPRPYPALASLGFRWTKEGAYWIAFDESVVPPVVAAIFHEAADIQRRIQRQR
jgi:plasmid stabilization system protein ParE